MADTDASSPTCSRIGGLRTAGQRNTATQDQMNKDREFIKRAWNLQGEVEDAFTLPGTRPISIGSSALSKLRGIATKEKNLAVAQGLFASVCKDSSGNPVPFSHKHACSIYDALKGGDTSTLKAPKAKDTKGNATPKSTPKRAFATSPDITPAKALQLIPEINVTALSSPSKPQLAAPEAVMVPKHAIGPLATFTIPKKRPTPVDNQVIAKKSRKENDPFRPALEPSMVEKSANQILKDKATNRTVTQPSISKVTPVNFTEEDALDKKIAEHRRANAAFFAGSAGRQAVYVTDTIRVSRPESPQSFVQLGQSKNPASSQSSAGHISSRDWLKHHCLGLHESVSIVLPCAASLNKMARPDQKHLVEQAVQVLDRAVKQLKIDMEAVFDESQGDLFVHST